MFSKYIKSEFSRNVFTLFSGTSIAQIIPFLVSPILTRLYSPEDFGLLALFVSIVSIISILVTLQYEAAIVLPKYDSDAANIVGLCLIITICITFISLLLAVVLNAAIARLLGDVKISFWLYFVPIPVFLTGIYNTLNYWSLRRKKYKRLAFRTISQSTTTAGLKVLFGFLGAIRSGLIAATIIGQATATAVLAWFTWKDDKQNIASISLAGMYKNSIAYKNFPKYTAWQGFFDIFNSSGSTFILSAFFGASTLGFFSLTLSLLQKPLQLIGTSVAQVYYQKASESYRSGNNIWGITKKLLLRLLIIALLVFTPLAISGPKLFAFVFGENWLDSGVYAQLLLPWLAVRFIVSPITSIPQIINKQKEFFLLSIIINITFPIALYLLFKYNVGIKMSLFIVSLFAAVCYLGILIWLRKQVRFDSTFK